jgi:hypothetical protein
MIILLPKLEFTISTICKTVLSKLLDHPFLPAFLWIIDDCFYDLLGGKFFKVSEYITKIIIQCGIDHMQVVAH